jgi:hypothetical protein
VSARTGEGGGAQVSKISSLSIRAARTIRLSIRGAKLNKSTIESGRATLASQSPYANRTALTRTMSARFGGQLVLA